MSALSHADFSLLVAQHAAPSVSLLLPTPPAERSKSRIRLGNQLRQAADQLAAAGLMAPARQTLLAPVWKLLEDQSFWEQPSQGLAVFVAPSFFDVYRAPAPLPELTMVEDRFYITPLLPFIRSGDEFYVLALGERAVRLLRCTQRSAAPVELPPWTPGTAEAPELAQLNRAVRAALRGQRAPLVLAGAAPLLARYRRANSYPHLHAAEIAADPDDLDAAQLQARAWELVRPSLEPAGEALDRYRQLCATHPELASRQLRDIVCAARAGAVAALLLTRGRQQWGVIDLAGELRLHGQRQPGDTELLNAAAIDVLASAGAVHVVAADLLPDSAPLAAILRSGWPR